VQLKHDDKEVDGGMWKEVKVFGGGRRWRCVRGHICGGSCRCLEEHGWVCVKSEDGTELARDEDIQHNRNYFPPGGTRKNRRGHSKMRAAMAAMAEAVVTKATHAEAA
jgi:hypothetical protein